MTVSSKYHFELPPEQQAIRDKCFHPSGTFVEFSKEEIEQSISARFEKIVRLYPDRIAVESMHERLTYAELNQAANLIATAILARCGEGQKPVGLLFPKGVPFVIAMLGILKAGKICVPMDPALPLARLSLMFGDLQSRLLVTDREGLALAKSLAKPDQCFNIDELKINRPEENPNLLLSPDAFALIFYTSGSTGLPKGVMENHRNLLHLAMRDTNDYHICADDRLTFVASSGRDIFRALLNGAGVYPVDIRQQGFSGLKLCLMKKEITIFNSVTSAFRNFAAALGGHERFPHLRLIMITGEAVCCTDVELYQRHFPDASIFVNRYGPNEAGGVISQYLMDKTTVITGGAVPVGYAATGNEIHLVDEDGKEVGIGPSGEIVVTSPYLSPGYWRQPERTREAFRVASLDDKSRVYHTGDIGQMSPDGCLIHLGRKDSQIKIRGNKVATAAVETALQNFATLKEAAVAAHEDNAGGKRLVAYVVPRRFPWPTVGELRDALASTLPEYMIPSAFVFLDKLPVTGIGKVDRNALPVPDKNRPQLDVQYAAPGNTIEAELARIWGEVLGCMEVGVLDNFFHLGGHSLAAMRVVSQVLKRFQLEIPLKSLFDAPTVADMARVILQNEAKQANDAELAQMLREVEAMTEEEAQKQLAGKSARSSTGDRHE